MVNIYNQYHDLIHSFHGLYTPQGVSIHGMNSNEFNEFILSDKQPTPVGIWYFDEGTDNIAHDATENHNDGTIHGASWTPRDMGYALYFDGNDDVTVPHSTSLDITEPFRIEAVINCLELKL